jgi:hypothetical protein
MFQPTKRGGMNNPVTITLKLAAGWRFILFEKPTARRRRV